MENCVEFLTAELFLPIQRRQILRDEIAFVTREVLEIAGPKIIDHRQARVRHSLLQREREVGADEAGAAGNENGRFGGRHGKQTRRSAPLINKSWAAKRKPLLLTAVLCELISGTGARNSREIREQLRCCNWIRLPMANLRKVRRWRRGEGCIPRLRDAKARSQNICPFHLIRVAL